MSHQAISFHYTLTDKDGKTLDSSRGAVPLTFLSGVGQIIPGLEKKLVLMKVGQREQIIVPSKEGYGIYDAQRLHKVTRAQLPEKDVKLGDVFATGEGTTYQEVRVVNINGDEITLDGNHPLAGQDLTFDVEIINMRAASPEEVAHGHIHGEGGHHH